MYKILSIFITLIVTSSSNPITKFQDWVVKHKIEFKNDNIMKHIFENWLINDKFIEEINSLNLTYTLGHNIYSGMNSDEFRNYMNFEQNNLLLINNKNNYLRTNDFNNYQNNFYLPLSVDWRTKNAVTPVKDQGQCGSCYSFSNTGALEGIYAINTGNLLSFSEQQIVDCSTIRNKGPNMGCNGGQIGLTMDWISTNGGLCLESDYPYISGETKTGETCNKSCLLVDDSKVDSHIDVKPNSDDAMMKALVQQPISVGIEADQKAFQLYSSGVFTATCGTKVDHAVLLVGYGIMDGNSYYILKNSWGESWGDKGYMYIGKDIDPNTNKAYNDGKGQCGVLTSGAYPVL